MAVLGGSHIQHTLQTKRLEEDEFEGERRQKAAKGADRWVEVTALTHIVKCRTMRKGVYMYPTRQRIGDCFFASKDTNIIMMPCWTFLDRSIAVD